MERNLKEALKHRRSYYAIDNQTTIPDAEIEEILDFAALHTPSASIPNPQGWEYY